MHKIIAAVFLLSTIANGACAAITKAPVEALKLNVSPLAAAQATNLALALA